MKMIEQLVRPGAIALAVLATLSGAAAQTYPAKPIRVIIGFGPGSGTDVSTRFMTGKITEAAGVQFIIDNKPGANGFIAAQEAARATPDGYTAYIGGNTTHGANPALFRSIPYDPIGDFTPVTRLAMAPLVLFVAPKHTVKSVAELTALAKQQPGKLTFATGSASHRGAAELYKRATGIDIVHVPYKSSPLAMNDVLGNHVDFMFVDSGAGVSYLRGGKLRALAVTSAQRVDSFPELPTMAESGFGGFEMAGWTGLFLPKGAPRDVVERLGKVFRDFMATPDAREYMQRTGGFFAPGTPEELTAWVRAELARWKEIVAISGIQPE
jgi:tripartite-type tricarboxylate transporter receptor subunit TctC